ncbi:unnamed protein product [Diatraea saccharalis]|uniref:Uncharacterized protein n=1 Tax=Diatraea saccharalis TaxID=40085 RepID=A0A9N9WD11_9NEOP|nr:unnamed protein product [Diatraea saccharalis]
MVLWLGCVCAHAQYQEERAPRYIASEPKVTSTPVPILKQINRELQITPNKILTCVSCIT